MYRGRWDVACLILNGLLSYSQRTVDRLGFKPSGSNDCEPSKHFTLCRQSLNGNILADILGYNGRAVCYRPTVRNVVFKPNYAMPLINWEKKDFSFD